MPQPALGLLSGEFVQTHHLQDRQTENLNPSVMFFLRNGVDFLHQGHLEIIKKKKEGRGGLLHLAVLRDTKTNSM